MSSFCTSFCEEQILQINNSVKVIFDEVCFPRNNTKLKGDCIILGSEPDKYFGADQSDSAYPALLIGIPDSVSLLSKQVYGSPQIFVYVLKHICGPFLQARIAEV